MGRATVLRCIAVASGLCGPAWGHLGGAEGVVPFVDDGVVVGAGTTWGLIGGGPDSFNQTCEEAIGDVPRDFVKLIVDGAARVYAATGVGVVRSDDDGCSWSPVAGGGERTVMALAAVSGGLVGITADAGRNNHLLVSDDGLSFSSRHETGPTSLLTSLAAGTDGALLVAGTDTAAATPFFLYGDPAGLQPLAIPLADSARLTRALAVDDDALWVSFLDGIGRGHLLRVPRVDGVPVVDDAVDVGAFDGLVRATGSAGGVRFAIAAGGVVFRVDDAGAAIAPEGWTRTTEGPLSCLRRIEGDDRLWGCATQLDEVWFKATRDGVTWEPVLPFADVTDRVCPATTPAASACAYRFAEPIDDTPPGAPPAPPAEGPSCAEATRATPWVLLTILLTRRRRSRR